MFGPRRIRKKETLGLSSLICAASSSFSMGIVVVAASSFLHGRCYYTSKGTIHGNQSKKEHELVCISSSSVHTIKQRSLGFFQSGSCYLTRFGVRPKSKIQVVFLVRIVFYVILSVKRTIQH